MVMGRNGADAIDRWYSYIQWLDGRRNWRTVIGRESEWIDWGCEAWWVCEDEGGLPFDASRSDCTIILVRVG